MQAVKEEDLGVVDLDEEVERRKCKLYTSNWFSVEVKTGVSCNYMNIVYIIMYIVYTVIIIHCTIP